LFLHLLLSFAAAFYLLFAVGRDDSYSEGHWFKLKGPWGTTPLSLPLNAQFVTAASTQAETATSELHTQRGSKRAG
jgi:hypothetical protein